MRYGYIKSNLVDLWTAPKFNSERASQLLFGQPVRIEKERAGHYFVRLNSSYTGWVDKRFVELISRAEYGSYTKGVNSFVIASQAAIYDFNGRSRPAPFFVYYGSKLFTRSTKKGFARIILPGKPGVLIKKSNLVPINRSSARKVTGRELVGEASRFLGVPYLWGGVTAAGFDCSGLVQTILARYGIAVPRDTKDQIRIGRKVARECITTGDLLFFKRHVGFAIGKSKIIHSSVGGGGVRINSLVPDGPDYREDLEREFHQARRIL